MAAPACHAGDAVARAASRAAGSTKVDLRPTLTGPEVRACKQGSVRCSSPASEFGKKRGHATVNNHMQSDTENVCSETRSMPCHVNVRPARV